LKLYHFDPQQEGISYIVTAADPKDAEKALLYYFNQRIIDLKNHSKPHQVKMVIEHYERALEKFEIAFMNMMLPDEYILVEIENNQVLEIDTP